MYLRRPPRWWPLGFTTLTLLVLGGIVIPRSGAIVASHPAYLLTLLAVTVAAIAIGAANLFCRAEASAETSTETSTEERPRRRPVVRGLEAFGIVVLLAALVYLRPLPASSVAVAAMAGGPGVTVVDGATRIELRPTAAARPTGLVFYPGALVDPRAYVPNLTPLAAAGYLVVILKLPYNIAFFDPRGAVAVMDAEPGISRWAVGGHSLGGVVASSAAAGTDPRVGGLLLWASYPNTSIADQTSLQVTSIFGSADGLATPAKIDASKVKLPPDTQYVEIVGGVHAFFGDYGDQAGDGTPTTSRDDAQRQIQAASLALLQRVDAAPGR